MGLKISEGWKEKVGDGGKYQAWAFLFVFSLFRISKNFISHISAKEIKFVMETGGQTEALS